MQIAIIAFDDFTDLDLILPWDILNRVQSICGVKDWNVRILGTKSSHLSTLGLPIPTSGLVEQAAEADGVVLCSGRGTRALVNDKTYLARLQLDPAKQFIGAQCSGALLLGALGLLKNRPVSAYFPIRKELEGYEAKLVKKSLVTDGRIATASSCLAGQFLSQWLIENLAGNEIAKKVLQTVVPLEEEM